MPLIAHHNLSETYAETGMRFHAIGENVSGFDYPTGRPGNIDLVDGCTKLTVHESDPITFTSQRSEITFSHQPDVTGERWYTWETMIPLTWKTESGMTLMQIHVDPESSEPIQSRALNFVLFIENFQFVPLIPDAISPIGSGSHKAETSPIQLGHWYSMCLHANWQTDKTGFLELYIDGVPLFKRFNLATTYNHPTQGPYAKLGVYNFFHATGWGSESIYIKNVNVWSGNDGYQAVMGTVPQLGKRYLQA